jgi:glucose-6-phosphate-specific signal transduction histidine kinase
MTSYEHVEVFAIATKSHLIARMIYTCLLVFIMGLIYQMYIYYLYSRRQTRHFFVVSIPTIFLRIHEQTYREFICECSQLKLKR